MRSGSVTFGSGSDVGSCALEADAHCLLHHSFQVASLSF